VRRGTISAGSISSAIRRTTPSSPRPGRRWPCATSSSTRASRSSCRSRARPRPGAGRRTIGASSRSATPWLYWGLAPQTWVEEQLSELKKALGWRRARPFSAKVEGPIAVGGAAITPRLVQRLLNDVGDDPDQLPILQHALMRTWSKGFRGPRRGPAARRPDLRGHRRRLARVPGNSQGAGQVLLAARNVKGPTRKGARLDLIACSRPQAAPPSKSLGRCAVQRGRKGSLRISAGFSAGAGPWALNPCRWLQFSAIRPRSV
jgi:hypothetical protein